MKAVAVHALGGPEVLTYEDVELPAIGDDDVLVRVHAAAVNPVDWKIRSGSFGQPRLPMIPGYDISGTIEHAGANVTEVKVGDEVFARVRAGGYAEFVTAPAADVVLKPDTIDHAQAAGVVTPALTAWQALDAMELEPGETVLVHGAGGAVGSFAVQLARLRGAHVVATATGEDIAYVRGLGAVQVIDYCTERFDELLSDIDAVLDVIGGSTRDRSWRVLKRGGVVVSTVGDPEPPSDDVRGIGVAMTADRAQLEELAHLLRDGDLKVRVGEILPLADARRAHDDGEHHRVHGRIVLDPTKDGVIGAS